MAQDIEKIKVLLVIDHLRRGGAEQQFVHIVNNTNTDKYIYLTEDKGIRIKDLDKSTSFIGGYGKRRPIRSILELKKIIESYKPDILHAFLMYSCLLASVCKIISRHKPIFIAQEFSPPDEILKEVKFYIFKKALLKFSYDKADKIVTVSKAVKESFINDGFVSDTDKTIFIYDGLDIEKYKILEPKHILREQLGMLQQKFYISFVGSLVKRKGVEYLIKAFKDITSPDVRLIIVGDGPNKDIFEDIAKGDSRIEFLGFRRDAVKYIKASDLFVLPSLYEGLPNVIIEAMSVGTPVIATNVSGIPELIEDKVNGFLVPPMDKDKLKDAIFKLIYRNALRDQFVRESLKKVSYFTIDRMVKDYENLYKSLANEHTASHL